MPRINEIGKIRRQLAAYIPEVLQELLSAVVNGVSNLMDTLVTMLQALSAMGQVIPSIVDII